MPLAMSTCMVDVRKPGRYSNIEGDLRTIFAATERKFRPSDLMIYLLFFFFACNQTQHTRTGSPCVFNALGNDSSDHDPGLALKQFSQNMRDSFVRCHKLCLDSGLSDQVQKKKKKTERAKNAAFCVLGSTSFFCVFSLGI